MTLLLARHGNTFAPGEPARRVGARTDLPLVAEGRAQAERLAAQLAAEGIVPARIVAGPLARTREFAAILAARLGGTVALDDRLRELDYGTWEGLEDAAIAARDAAALAAWERRLEWPAAAGWGEGEATVLARLRGVLDDAAAGPLPLLAVTSNGILRLLRRLIEGPPPAGEGYKVRTGALCRLRRAPDPAGARPDGLRPGAGGWHIAAWDERPPVTGPAPAGAARP